MLPDVYVNQMAEYHPHTMLGNDFFEAILPTSNDWIVQRTGIRTRGALLNYGGRFPTTELAKRACNRLFEKFSGKSEVDLIILGGAIDELAYPSSASLLSRELKLDVPTYHIKNACASGPFGLAIAKSFIQTGMARTVLVVNSDPTTYHQDYSTRENCILWGDGATVALVTAKPVGLRIGPIELMGWGDMLINSSDPGAGPALTLDEVRDKIPNIPDMLRKLPSNRRGYGNFAQDGLKVYSTMIDLIPKLVVEYLAKQGLEVKDLHYFITHQANLNMQEEICRRLGIPPEGHLHNVETYGNRSSVGCMSVLAENLEGKKFAPGDRVLITAFGAGISIGTVMFEAV